MKGIRTVYAVERVRDLLPRTSFSCLLAPLANLFGSLSGFGENP